MRRRHQHAAFVFLLTCVVTACVHAESARRTRGAGPQRTRPAELAAQGPRGHSLDASGFLPKAKRTQVGVLETYYGVTDSFAVGTLTLPWFALLPFGGSSANASLKLGARVRNRVWASLTTGILYAHLTTDSNSSTSTYGEVWAFPTTVALSWRPAERHVGSVALRYLALGGDVRHTTLRSEFDASVFTDMLTGIASWTYRASPWLGLVARGKLRLWRDDMRVRFGGVSGDSTQFSVDALASTAGDRTAAAVLGALQVSLGRVHLLLGAGYGSYFVPGLGFVAIERPLLFPEFDLYARF